jgi:PAS domain S-box-containing protein
MDWAAGTAALTLAYWASAELGLRLGLVPQVTAVWPPAGIALAAVLWFGARAVPGIALGALLANARAAEPLATAFGIAAGNTLEAIIGAWLLRRVGFDLSLSRLRDVLSLIVLGAVLSTTVGATIGVVSLCLGGVQPWHDFGSLWGVWWLGDATGDLLIAPVLLTLPMSWRVPHRPSRLVEAAVLMDVVIVTCFMVFGRLIHIQADYPIEYVVFPLVIWAALRFGTGLSALVSLVISAVAIWGTLNGYGPLARWQGSESLILLQVFMAVVAVTGLVLSAVVAERRRDAERYRELFQNANDIIYTLDLDGRITSFNRRAEQLFGYGLDEAIGRSVFGFVPPEYLPIMYEALRKKLAGEASPTIYEVEVIGKSGKRVPVEVSSRLIFDHGAPVGIQGIARDIGERRRADEALRAAQQELQLITDNMAAPISRCSRDLRYLWVSNSYAQWLRRPARDIVGRPIIDVLGREAFDRLRPYFDRVLSGELVQYEEEIDFLGLGRRWINAVYTPTFDATGVADGWVAQVIDIDDRKRMEQALMEADRRKDQFLATLGHELRNPLAPIVNSVQLLFLDDLPAPDAKKAKNILDRQLRQLTRLVDDLLDVSRFTRGKINVHKERIELAHVIDDAVEATRSLVEERRHELSINVPAEPLWLDADPTRLAQVFSNLLNNAAKYTDPGGHIWLTVQQSDSQVTVSVRDNGIGIAPDDLPGIFEVFSQLAPSTAGVHGGLGIGLSLVRGLVELHGGSVEAKSQGRGKGSEFLVRLPISLKSAGPVLPQGEKAAQRHPV